MKPFILTLVAILTTSTATLALPTVTYADQSFLERRAGDDDPSTPPTQVESSSLPAGGQNRDPPTQSKTTIMPSPSKTPPPTRPQSKIAPLFSRPKNTTPNSSSVQNSTPIF
ncbi:hypothetical protein BASA60_006181 [Batrachochytrium salamandrivorans]|nr:hypothetical protein BASA60_006181 [Batrachochytrium salamandrivorans]